LNIKLVVIWDRIPESRNGDALKLWVGTFLFPKKSGSWDGSSA